jgi:mono/diheme cytochrome c family protein
MKQIQLTLICCVIGFITAANASDSLMVAQGESLFTANCKACHHLEMRLVGPALKGVENRHERDWIIDFIQSSQTMVQNGDSTAVALFNTYNKVIMPDQSLSENDIESILAYVATAGQQPVATGDIVRPQDSRAKAHVRPLKFTDVRFWLLYTITVVLVIVAIYYKAELIALQKKVGINQ